MVDKTLHRKLKIAQQEPNYNHEWTWVLRKDKQFHLHWWQPSYCSCLKWGDKSWKKIDGIVAVTNGTYPWSSVTQIFCSGHLWHIFCSGHLWHRYSVTITQVSVATVECTCQTLFTQSWFEQWMSRTNTRTWVLNSWTFDHDKGFMVRSLVKHWSSHCWLTQSSCSV